MLQFRDGWDSLLGRSVGQRKYATRVAQIEAEWLDLLVTISDTLEKLNAWHQRIVQRDKRARKAEAAIADHEENGAEAPAAAPTTPVERKAAIRQRVSARQAKHE